MTSILNKRKNNCFRLFFSDNHRNLPKEECSSRSVAVFEFAASVVWDVPQFML